MRHLMIMVLINACFASAGRSDTRADRILGEAFAKLQAARSFSADITATMRQTGGRPVVLRGRILALKPNYLRVDLEGRGRMRYVCDGRFYYRHVSPAEYVQERAERRPTVFVGIWEGEIDAFYGGRGLLRGLTTAYRGTGAVDGTACDLVEAVMTNPKRTVVYAISRKDRLILRATIRLDEPPRVQEQTNRIQNHRFDVAAVPRDFTFKPDPGTRQRPLPDSVRRTSPATDALSHVARQLSWIGPRACELRPPARGTRHVAGRRC